MTNLIGQFLGRYHILEQLGQGGMATVYKAYDTRLERDVAVKVLRTERFAPADLERILKRFEREAKALARLTHPNIVPVIDYGEHEGTPYLVMPYFPGGTLKGRLGKPMPWQEALRLLLPVARALDYAHEHNILHRDVKPSNILLTEKGEPMLTDFGIAKILDLEDGQTLTATGVGVGTPEYMSPEQGLGKPVDACTDVYSLGVVLYEMATGCKPYTADTPPAILLMKAIEPLPRPTQFAPDLPEAVEKLLLKALAKNPEDRYTSMAEMAMAMERVLISRFPLPELGEEPERRAEPANADETPTADEGAQASPAAIRRKVLALPGKPRPAETPKPKRKLSPGWMAGIILLVLLAGGPIAGRMLTGHLLPAPPSETPTITQSKTPTMTPTATPTPSLPVLPGTPIPFADIPISSQNAEGIVQLARWGKGTINQVTYSPDGHLLAMASSLGIYFYDLQTLQEIRFIETEAWVTSITFSPDGALLASGSYDKTAKVWRVADGTLLQMLKGHTGSVLSVAFSPDGQTLASSDWDRIYLWRVADGALLQTLEGHTSNVNSVAFSPDGALLASGSWDGTAKAWRVADGALMQTLKGHTGSVLSVVFSPDGQTLASSAWNRIYLWRVADGTLLRTLRGSWPSSVAFSPDGQTLASSDWNRIYLWQLADGTLLRTLSADWLDVLSVAFSPDGQTLASSDWNRIYLWRVADGALLQTLEGHTDWVRSVVFSPDGALLASGSEDGTVRLWGVR